jgi:hypothetical protein
MGFLEQFVLAGVGVMLLVTFVSVFGFICFLKDDHMIGDEEKDEAGKN